MTEVTASGASFDAMTPTRRLDLRGEVCPTPTDETLRILSQMAPGEVLEVESDYYPAKSTLPFLCDKRGYAYAFSGEQAPTDRGGQHPVWRMRIEKT
ncbi:MAG TPA: sulfurtransferase TusA family protein [Egibacteraceae bacterium]|nr:sulfurtransferase TusA family protein [Egibacteraceae bacterium]